MELNGKWILSGKDENGKPLMLDACVPGCVHTDLQKHGIIGDMFYRDNSKSVQWIENNDYTYTKTFTLDSIEPNAYLEFDGLDTYCDIYLNSQKIAHCENMHISYGFCVDGIVKTGENVLEVRFFSPVKAVEGLELLPGAFTRERMHTRRIQCTYSWDWVDRFVTMGIYRDVRLVFRKRNEIDDVYVYTNDINPYSAQIALKINIRDFAESDDILKIEIYSPENELVFSKERKLIRRDINEFIDIHSPEMWYPNGYGKQPLYTLRLTGANKKEIKFGIRKLVILQKEDAPGSEDEAMSKAIRERDFAKHADFNERGACFTVLVNDIKIMCKGGNWVPCEPFPSEETPQKITRLLEEGRAAGVNMLRVWGGGIFERDEFYSECDRLGILVTQDFLMACGTYPEKEEWFVKALNEEAKAAALRLRNHTCLAWWSGDNENAVRGNENKTDFAGYLSATFGIEPVLSVLDPQRRFLPSSPYGGDVYSSATRGTTHVTYYLGPIFTYVRDSDFADYRDYFNSYLSRMNVEQPAIGMPFVSSLKKFMTDDDIFGDDTYMSEFHTKNNPGLGKITLYGYVTMLTEKIFGKFTSGEDRVRKMQMLHCEWTRLSLELYRRNKWYSSGIVYWMFNDCWPAANGWSFLDYYTNPKPAYYTFKRCAKPVMSSLLFENGKLDVYVSNDSLEKHSGSGKVYAYDFIKNEVLHEEAFTYTVAENSSASVYRTNADKFEKYFGSSVVLICDTDNDRSFLIPKRYSDLDITYGKVRIVKQTDTELTVTADEFTPYAMLDVPYMLSDNCFMLKKGETVTVKIIGGLQ